MAPRNWSELLGLPEEAPGSNGVCSRAPAGRRSASGEKPGSRPYGCSASGAAVVQVLLGPH